MPCSATCDAKKSAVTRLPTGRPCMSGKATTTVSMDPSAIPASMSSRPAAVACAMLAASPVSVQPYGTLGAVIPLIGVSTYVATARWGSWERRAAVLPEAYFELVAAAGGRPLLLPPASTAPGGPGGGCRTR